MPPRREEGRVLSLTVRTARLINRRQDFSSSWGIVLRRKLTEQGSGNPRLFLGLAIRRNHDGLSRSSAFTCKEWGIESRSQKGSGRSRKNGERESPCLPRFSKPAHLTNLAQNYKDKGAGAGVQLGFGLLAQRTGAPKNAHAIGHRPELENLAPGTVDPHVGDAGMVLWGGGPKGSGARSMER